MLKRRFFERDPLSCARELIGCTLKWGALSGIVVETEAYDVDGDEACHTAFRPSARVFVTSHRAGAAYVYFSYGVHWMLNVLVKGKRMGFVLIRALEPVEGIEQMKKARGTRDPLTALLRPRKAYDGAGRDRRTPRQGLVRGSGVLLLHGAKESRSCDFAARGHFARCRASLEVLCGRQSACEPLQLYEGRAGCESRPAPKLSYLDIPTVGGGGGAACDLLCARSKAQTGGRECECSEDFDEFHDNFPSFRSRLLRGTLAKPNRLTTTTSKNHASCSQSYSMVLSRFSFDPSLGTQEMSALV